MLDEKPASRISIEDALKHPFFKGDIKLRGGLKGSLSESGFYRDVEQCRKSRDAKQLTVFGPPPPQAGGAGANP
jgi:hypothetical protein